MKNVLMAIYRYFWQNRLIYIGVFTSNLACLTFPLMFYDSNSLAGSVMGILVLLYMISFILPIVLCVIYIKRCFLEGVIQQKVSNIIHAYVGTILLFTAVFFQSSVMGDIQDSSYKYAKYTWQAEFKSSHKDMKFHRVKDRRAFDGIDKRLWTGIDNPDITTKLRSSFDGNYYHNFKSGDYEIPLDYIEELSVEVTKIKDLSKRSKAVPYNFQWQHVQLVYLDCFCYSIGCISLTGFSGISPKLWYVKIFTVFEILMGIAILIFAIGMLFSNNQKVQNAAKIIYKTRQLKKHKRRRM